MLKLREDVIRALADNKLDQYEKAMSIVGNCETLLDAINACRESRKIDLAVKLFILSSVYYFPYSVCKKLAKYSVDLAIEHTELGNMTQRAMKAREMADTGGKYHRVSEGLAFHSIKTSFEIRTICLAISFLIEGCGLEQGHPFLILATTYPTLVLNRQQTDLVFLKMIELLEGMIEKNDK